jgi:DNA-binding NarL/FixJ family response regulator
VAVAHNVRATMEAAVRNKFDLLISDIALADGSGTDLMLQLHAISDIPGIAISGFGNTGDIQKVCGRGSPSISSNRLSSTTSKRPSNVQSLERPWLMVQGPGISCRVDALAGLE